MCWSNTAAAYREISIMLKVYNSCTRSSENIAETKTWISPLGCCTSLLKLTLHLLSNKAQRFAAGSLTTLEEQ